MPGSFSISIFNNKNRTAVQTRKEGTTLLPLREYRMLFLEKKHTVQILPKHVSFGYYLQNHQYKAYQSINDKNS
jgi:hypothetical protein